MFLALNLFKPFVTGPSRPTMPKPELSLFSCGTEKKKVLDLQLGGPSGDGAAFMPFPANPPVPRPRIPSRAIRDVLSDNAR